MKLLRIVARTILIIIMISFALSIGRDVYATEVEIIRGHLLVDRAPFTIKGINYSPVPIGVEPETTPPYGDYFTSNYSDIHNRDLPLLREMGANTIRILGWNNGADHTDFLDKAYNSGINPIYVILTFEMGPGLYPDINSPEAREKIKTDFRAMIAEYKNHPAILMWSIGDELNSPIIYGDRLNDLFSLINEMAQEARSEEGTKFHPVTTALADLNLIDTIATYEPLTPNLDIWGANIYRGASFGTLFNDFKKVSSKPLVIMGFGIDAYDERIGDEYEKTGVPHQADYAEFLWKEILANWNVCPGGLIRAYTDEWWLGKYGNTLEGCPDDDPSVHSPCGHPSESDPDGFINYEWFGIMRVVSPTLEKGGEGGFFLGVLEPREIYNTLKFLWTVIEIKTGPVTTIPQVRLSLKPLDFSKTITVEELMAAGQLGGQLYPTREVENTPRENRINRSFAEAIEAWNRHDYKKGIELFKKHVQNYPDSPWASEAILHIGCDAQYHGRYTEAEESFRWIIEDNQGKNYEGAERLLNKARLRLATLKVNQNNFREAKQLFATLKKEGSDWRDRTYASHWIQRLSRYTANQLSMLNCGTQALAYLLEKEGRKEDARKVLGILPEGEPGHSLKDLSGIASKYGYDLSAVRLSPPELEDLPLPAIMHINAKNQGDSGHYWILEKLAEDKLELFNPQAGLRFEQTKGEFQREWSGLTLAFANKEYLPGIRLAEGEMEQFFGGCCGVPRPPDNLGSPGRNMGPGSGNACPFGSPAWSVSMISMNLYVNDIPFWYTPPIGPPVGISLSYNSQSSLNQYEPFGNKWQFNYGTYLTVDTSENVTLFMPDGREDVYVKITGGYNSPYQVFNTLTKIAANHYELKFPNNVVYVYKIPPGTSSQQPFLIEIRDPHNQSLTFGYDSQIRLTAITDALGRVTTLAYNDPNDSRLVTSVSDQTGRTASFGYDADKNLISITDMGGYESTLTYDLEGYKPDGSYGADVYLTSIENQRGRWEFYIEPSDGILLAPAYPAPGAVMWQNYRITVMNPPGNKEEYFFFGSSGAYSWYVSPKHYIPYSPSYNNETNAPKTYYYNTKILSVHGEISKIANPEGGSLTFGYDPLTGDRTSIQINNETPPTILEYDKGKVKKITDPLLNVHQFFYNADNNLDYMIDPASNLYDFQYEGYDLRKIVDPRNGETNFTPNSYGQLLTLQDARGGPSTVFDYYESGPDIRRLETVTNPIGGVYSYTYDSRGRVYTHTDPRQNTITYPIYDGLNRVRQVRYQDQSTKNIVYNCCGLESVTDSNGTVAIAYDEITKRPSTITDVYGKVISFTTYDKNGNLETLTYPGNKAVRYEYDKADRLIKVTDWLNNETRYEYTPAGDLFKTYYPNGTTVTYGYDNAHRLTSILDMKADGTVNSVYKYTLDSLGNRKEISLYQPLIAVPPTLSAVSSNYDNDNRLQVAGETDYEYDANGNLDTVTTGSDVRDHTWDYEDRLTGLTFGGNVYEYKYDGLGNRVSKKVNGVETRYVMGLAETDANGNITAYYVYGLGLISKITPTDQAYFYHFDGIGSTIAISDSTGNIVNKYAYDEFGKVLGQEEAIPNPFKYVGRYGVMDEGNGLLYMRARYYDPEAGRFISKDPIGYAGGDINLYAYVENNPVNYIDPSGKVVIAVPIGVYYAGTALLAASAAYLQSPAGQQALRSLYKTIEDHIKDIEEAKKRLAESKCETREPWEPPDLSPKPPEDPKLKWKFIIAKLLQLISKYIHPSH